MQRITRGGALALLLLVLVGCDPSDRRPGLWLSGDVAQWPADWTFTDALPQIAVQVHTPYWVPHSVTIWCGQVDGRLYIGASAPETKRWPGWVDQNRDVSLKIDGKLYAATLVPLSDPAEIALVQAAFAAKYRLDAVKPPLGSSRMWKVEPRSS